VASHTVHSKTSTLVLESTKWILRVRSRGECGFYTGVNRPPREAGHSSPASVEVKNALVACSGSVFLYRHKINSG